MTSCFRMRIATTGMAAMIQYSIQQHLEFGREYKTEINILDKTTAIERDCRLSGECSGEHRQW